MFLEFSRIINIYYNDSLFQFLDLQNNLKNILKHFPEIFDCNKKDQFSRVHKNLSLEAASKKTKWQQHGVQKGL